MANLGTKHLIRISLTFYYSSSDDECRLRINSNAIMLAYIKENYGNTVLTILIVFNIFCIERKYRDCLFFHSDIQNYR